MQNKISRKKRKYHIHAWVEEWLPPLAFQRKEHLMGRCVAKSELSLGTTHDSRDSCKRNEMLVMCF